MNIPTITRSPAVDAQLSNDEGATFIVACISKARAQQWGSVTAAEAHDNNTSKIATGAYPLPDELGSDVLMVDIENDAITIRLLGERVPA